MTGSRTIVPGTTIASGYIIANNAGPGFTLTNFGVLGAATTGIGVQDKSAGNEIVNEAVGRILASATGDAIRLSDSGRVVNTFGGTISGGTGIYAFNAGDGGSTVTNQGRIAGTSGSGGQFGIRLNAGGVITNLLPGTITGSYGGVDIEGAAGNVVNQSTISGGAAGVFMRAGGYLGNDITGTIAANYAVAIGGGSTTVRNVGQISGGKLGVGLSDGGIVANLLGGTITATAPVQISGGAGEVYNIGAINAHTGGTAVSLAAGFKNLLALYPGASFVGVVDGGNTLGAAAVSTLRLAKPLSGGVVVGTLTGLGSKYVNFANLTVSSGASWVLGAGSFGALGPNAYSATINDSGTLTNYAALRAPVVLRAGGRVINGAGGSIISERYGVDGRAIAGTIVNDGLVEAIRTGGIGIEGDGGAVTNLAQGTISGGLDGVLMLSNGPATIVNQGLIEANSYETLPLSNPDGVILQSGGIVSNQAGGTISAFNGVVINNGTGTVINAGTISAVGGGKAVQLAAGFANQVTIVPGAAFSGGIVDGGNVPHVGVASTLVLAAGAKTGTLTGLGSEYVGFGTLTVNHAASWVLGASTFQAGMAIVDNGTLTNDGVATAGATIGNFGVLINAFGGTITGPTSLTTSVYAPVTSTDPTLINSGYISTPLNEAVRFHDGGSVTNTATGLIVGLYGVVISGQTGTVTNSGKIGTTPGLAEGIGVRLKSGGTLNNLGGTISGKLYGVYTGNNYVVAGPAFILNEATISGGQTGIIITNGFGTGGTVVNAGLIDPGSSGFAVRFGAGAGDELDIVPGARFGGGLVFGGNAIGATQTSLLRLNAGTIAGTLSGGSSVYEDFGAITVDPGANWTFAAGGTIFAGTRLTDKGTLINLGTVRGDTTLAGTSSLTNASGGLFSAHSGLYVLAGAVSTITNAGLITGDPNSGSGVYDTGKSLFVTNQATAIVSGYYGIQVTNGNAFIVNQGTIRGSSSYNGVGVLFQPASGNTPGTFQLNNTLGHIDGAYAVYAVGGSSTIKNSGFIDAASTTGKGLVLKVANASVTNQSAGTIGGHTGVYISAPLTVLQNDSNARIGNPLSADGVVLVGGGNAPGDVRLTNNGTILGSVAAVLANAIQQTITNTGTVGVSPTGSQFGIKLGGTGNVVTNIGLVTGGVGVSEQSGNSTLVNFGHIVAETGSGFGTAIGVQLFAGGYVFNARSGSIAGLTGIAAYNPGPTTIRNAGFIQGGISIQAGASDLVEIRPGSTITGVVDGGNPVGAAAASTLELGIAVPPSPEYGASASYGTLNELGSRYIDFSQVIIDANAVWSFSGQDSLGAGDTLTNNGFMSVDGQLLVDGVVNAGADLLTIGESGDGSLTVENGGTVVANGAGLGIGATDGIGAEVVVTGPHSLLNVTGAFVVGGNAAGDLRIQAGGTVVSDTTDSVIGENGADSSVQLAGAGSNWQITGGLVVGELSSGALSVGAGSTVTTTGSVAIGRFSGDGSSADVFGSGASLQVGGELYVGLFSSGVLSIEGGANVTAGFFTAGDSASAVGQVNLSGAGSSLVAADSADIANAGDGGMSVSRGATFSAPTLTIGVATGASGVVSVSGSGSAITVTDTITVGSAGAGSLSITNGASVSATTLAAGSAIGSSGVITVTGANAALTTTGDLSIGGAGAGELAILNGANVFIGGSLNIGQTAGGSGNADIEDTTGTVFIGGDLNIGAGGPGALTIGPNATVELDNGGVNLGPDGSLIQFSPLDPPTHLTIPKGRSNAFNFDGTQTYLAYVDNLGAISIGSGVTFALDTPTVYGAGGAFTIGSGTDLVLNADTVTGQVFSFADNTGTLTLGADAMQTIDIPSTGSVFTSEPNPNFGTPLIGGFHGVIAGFSPGDAIAVTTQGPATFSQSGTTVSVIENGATVGVLGFDTAAAAHDAFVTPGALVDNVLCFLAGTLIGTPDGQVAVERLVAGDLVRTASGAVRPVAWVGHGRVLATRGRRGPATPVIVRKGALGPNVPHTDLRVTKGHALWFDGVLIPVEFLVNHRSILWDDRAQEVSVYHVELETHDVLLANGAAAESYRDDGNRWLFQNGNTGWDQPAKAPCAPVLTGGPVVDAVWRRLLDRCGSRPGVPLTEDPDFCLWVDGVRVDGVRTGDVWVFSLSGCPGNVRLRSRAAAPQEIGVASDPRCLGVAVKRVVVRQGTRFRVVRADDAVLGEGFHAFEPGTGLRWTDGNAGVPAAVFDGFVGAVEVVVHLGGTAVYVDEGWERVA